MEHDDVRSQNKTLIAIDGNSLLHRAYYALPGMTARDGTPTGALHGFFSMLLPLTQRQPDYLLVAFDVHGKTFRHLKYEDYKAGRRETPDDLRKQFPLLKELLTDMGITVIECPGFEADDILGTMAIRCGRKGIDALLVTGDRDALQLVSESTHVLMTKKGITETVEYTPEKLMETYGLTPDRMRDLKGLMGDTSDHIPGIPGVGEKTALRLLGEYGTLNAVLEHAGEIKGKLGERIRENADSAELSFWLGTIETNAPVERQPEDCGFAPEHMARAAQKLRALDLRSIASRLPQGDDAAQQETAPAAETAVVSLETEEQLQKLLQERRPSELALELSKGISFAFDEETTFIPAMGETLFDAGLAPERVFAALKPVLEDASVPKVLFDAKSAAHMLERYGIQLAGVQHDAMIADYLLNAIRPAATFQQLAEQTLHATAPRASQLFTIRSRQMRQLAEEHMADLYSKIEMPLSDVLLSMERKGFPVDETVLLGLQKRFDERIRSLQSEIYALAGENFNILSPKQLGVILFEKLRLPTQKKTKSGYSTDADTLERLKDKHEIVEPLLEYRFLTKLKSTFVDGLLTARGADGRVRSRFNQCLTATGRISSSEPNLQNIPVRTPLGREIRKAFVASDGRILVGADYSQIELRILAHLSGDEGLIEAFRSGDDIHRRTAGEVFGIPFELVTDEMRSAAKAVNFGIIYGISDYGLANNLGIPVKQAGDYIKRYLERYPKVSAYMKNAVQDGKERGYAVTMFGRRRALPELQSGNYNTRSFGERVAMNMPIQGSAADIIKLAMVSVAKTLREEGLHSELILQIHDELILDACVEEMQRVKTLVRECMEQVTPLAVPLVAEVKTGHSWYETK